MDVPTDLHANERLGRLLRLLRPAPEGWVARAKHIFSERPDGSSVPALLTDGDLAALARLLERDASFRERFDRDPAAAA